MRVLLTALFASAAFTAVAHAQSIGDYSFEAVDLGDNQYVYDPVDAGGWSFTGDTGVSASGPNNPWFTGSAAQGNQAAFIQGGYGGTNETSQTVTGLTVGTVYSLSFYLAERIGIYGAYDPDPIEVLVNGNDLATVTPATYGFVDYTLTFEASSASESLAFLGTATASGDFDTNLDDVTLQDIPEPASVLALIAGLAVVGVSRRRGRTAAGAAHAAT